MPPSNMLLSIDILLIAFAFASSQCANICIEPQRVLLNTSSSARLICTKDQLDENDFEVYLLPDISKSYIRISTNYLNDTAIEITIQALNHIGRFSVVCSSNGDHTQATVIISKPPGLLVRAEPCIVYYDEYIDCILRAPVIVQAIHDHLNYTFDFVERRLPSQPIVYRRNPRLIQIDPINKTLTFRWFPQEPGHFPLDFKMIVYATIAHFGTTNHTMDMTPIFRISSNFTVDILSSTDLRVNFKSEQFICHGNLTRVDQHDHSNQRENLRQFAEFNQSIIHVTNLRPDTSYRLCFYCRRHEFYRSISNIACQQYKTSKIINLSAYDYTILIFFFSIVIIIFLITRSNCSKLSRCRTDRDIIVIELKLSTPDSK